MGLWLRESLRVGAVSLEGEAVPLVKAWLRRLGLGIVAAAALTGCATGYVPPPYPPGMSARANRPDAAPRPDLDPDVTQGIQSHGLDRAIGR
jgi:hypothetical protein